MGAFLDTIADKIFITFIFIGFTYIDRVSIWITTLLIAREFIITGLRGLAGNEGIMIPPSKFGKAKASLQFWAIGFVMMDFSLSILSFSIADLFVLHALIFSYISGYQYLLGYLKQSKMKYKNIFITGSTGVVGKPLLKKLIEKWPQCLRI